MGLPACLGLKAGPFALSLLTVTTTPPAPARISSRPLSSCLHTHPTPVTPPHLCEPHSDPPFRHLGQMSSARSPVRCGAFGRNEPPPVHVPHLGAPLHSCAFPALRPDVQCSPRPVPRACLPISQTPSLPLLTSHSCLSVLPSQRPSTETSHLRAVLSVVSGSLLHPFPASLGPQPAGENSQARVTRGPTASTHRPLSGPLPLLWTPFGRWPTTPSRRARAGRFFSLQR